MDLVETGIPRHENLDRVVTPSPTRHLGKEGVRDRNDTMPYQRGEIWQGELSPEDVNLSWV